MIFSFPHPLDQMDLLYGVLKFHKKMLKIMLVIQFKLAPAFMKNVVDCWAMSNFHNTHRPRRYFLAFDYSYNSPDYCLTNTVYQHYVLYIGQKLAHQFKHRPDLAMKYVFENYGHLMKNIAEV